MNFFKSQDIARKKTSLLLFYFFLAVVLTIFTFDAFVYGVILYTDTDKSLLRLSHEVVPISKNPYVNMALMVILTISPLVAFTIILGTFFKLMKLRGGGVALAKMVKAKPLESATTDFSERRFLNIVEEMSIASGVAVPRLYVMEEENAVNAFVAGNQPKDMVMVVTKGALTQLNRDELQGVIGHEYSHIFNSDMKINLRLIGLLGGLFFLSQVGYYILRMSDNQQSSRSNSKSSKGNLVIFLVGFGLFLVGYIGLFFGRLIKASVSRQRELLADASSVQYTRNPVGLVNALKRILQSETGSYLKSKYVEDISHLCFSSSRALWLRDLLATHPPLEKRIQLLDPQGLYASENLPPLEIPVKSQSEKSSTVSKKAPLDTLDFLPILGGVNTAVALTISSAAIEKTIGNPTQAHFDYAEQLIALIPKDLYQMAHNPQELDYIFYALLLDGEGITSELEDFLKAQAIDVSFLNKIKSNIYALPLRYKLPLVELAMPAFKERLVSERVATLQTLEKLSLLIKRRLSHFLLLALIGKATIASNSPPQTTYSNFEPVLPEVSILLAFILSCGRHNIEKKTILYIQALKNFTAQNIEPPAISTTPPIALHQALMKLNLLYPLCKEQLIKVSFACIEEDNQVTLEEAEVIRVLAGCLDSPIPLIIPTEKNIG